MKQFMDQDFLLSTDTAKWLYHDVAAKLPIIDYFYFDSTISSATIVPAFTI